MVVTCWGNAGVLATIPVAAALDQLSVIQLIAAAFISASLAVFFDAASFAVLPTLTEPDGLPQATSMSVAVHTVISTGGPAVAGALAAVVGAAPIIGLDAITFLAAGAIISRLRLRPGYRSEGGPRRRMRADVADGLRFMWRQPLVRSLTLLGIGNSLTAGAMLGLLVAFVVRQIHIDDTDPRVGLFFTACGLGTLIATAALPRLSRFLPVGWITLGGLAANWVLVTAWVTVTTVPWGLALLCMWQMTNSLVVLNGIIVRQQVTPDSLQGRVNATGRMIAWGGQPIGAALAGVLAETWSVQAALLIIGSGVLVSGFLGLGTPLRSAATRVTAVPVRS
jgi:hypothetical protein